MTPARQDFDLADPGYVSTGLQRHLTEEDLRGFGMVGEDGGTVVPEYFSTPAQAAGNSVLLAASPLVDGVTGAYFIYHQQAPVVNGGPDEMSGVAAWSADPGNAHRLWELAEKAFWE